MFVPTLRQDLTRQRPDEGDARAGEDPAVEVDSDGVGGKVVGWSFDAGGTD